MPTLNINGQSYFSDSPPDTPLLWVIREDLRLTGTKFGCGAGLCGSCTVHLNGQPVRSCQVKVGDVEGAAITTIEGLDPYDRHPVQQAWIEHQVPQCGFCQSGQIMQAAALIAVNANPTDGEIVSHMNGNLCRCATYPRIVGAVKRAAQIKRETVSLERNELKEGASHG
jgi:isoquinoline 1-oxidoreductase alpha subunit